MSPHSSSHVPLSVLDLVPVSEGMSFAEAMTASMDTAIAADRAGFARYWFAEHHNTPAIASSATAVLIDRAAALTERIRVGSGGIMLPNHSPLSVIEQFGTLAQLHGDRIDLGLGRAPGTDPITAQFLARTSAEPQSFLDAVALMRSWSSSLPDSGMRVSAPVAEGTEVPMWVLGSTVNGAQLAATLGMPFSVASHFAPEQHRQALDVYRQAFDADAATAQIDAPHTMVGVNVVVADTDSEAEHLFTTMQQTFIGILTGQRGPTPPPRDLGEIASAAVIDRANAQLSVRAIGSPTTVVHQLEQIVADTGADELIVAGAVFDPVARVRSLELLAEAWLG